VLEQVAMQRPDFEAAVLRPSVTRLLELVSR
jgi:hypothetical protein